MRLLTVLGCCAILSIGCEKKASDAPTPTPSTPATTTAVKPAEPATTAASVSGKQIAIAIGEDGFAPNEVKIGKGEQATLVFTRTTDKTCAKDVDFPELKVTKPLPLNQPVAVVIPSGESRTLTFQCGMGMYKSKIVVQ